MPRKKLAPHERMINSIKISMPEAMLTKLSALGLTWRKSWVRKGEPFPDSHENVALGVRRLFSLAAPLLDARIADVAEHYANLKDAHDKAAAVWMAGEAKREQAYIKRAARAQGLEPEDF